VFQHILSKLSPSHKSKLRGWYGKAKLVVVRRFLSYDPPSLKRRLAELGIQPGDTLLVHTAYGPLLGFKGLPNTLIATFMEAIGPGGNLVMVSMPFFSAMSEYLKRRELFDVRRTISKMGLVSEAFRRLPGVRRSLHPTHPLLVLGPEAERIVSGHENCLYPCGPGSPFEKLVELNGKVLFFGVTEFHFTFHHYLEHIVKDDLPFRLYEEEPYIAKVIDYQGQTRSVVTYAFTSEAISRRRVKILFDELSRRGQLKRARIGNTRMVLMDLQDTVVCTRELAVQGIYFYDTTDIAGNRSNS
jgi:aminoglycoside 3-N-acetyltransferase